MVTRKLWSVVLIMCVATICSTACSSRDQVISVDEHDPEMVAAIAKAKNKLPEFWKVYEKRDNGESGFALKVIITDSNGTELFWVTDIERRNGKITGKINNDPNTVKNVKLGQAIQVPESDIADWLYMREGKMVGNETVRPLLTKMPAADAAKVRAMMANP